MLRGDALGGPPEGSRVWEEREGKVDENGSLIECNTYRSLVIGTDGRSGKEKGEEGHKGGRESGKQGKLIENGFLMIEARCGESSGQRLRLGPLPHDSRAIWTRSSVLRDAEERGRDGRARARSSA
jgi:hypothetical protein